MKYLLGIDLGTTGTKSVLFDERGSVIRSKTVDYPIHQPFNGWAEQSPRDWWNAAVTGIREVISGISASDISGIGLSGQMHGLVLLDENGVVLRESIIWCDQRTAAECDELNSLVGARRLVEITANPALTGFTASKILWVRNNEPHVYNRCRHILLPKDYIRYMLTGEFATDVSDAAGMQLMDVPGRRWSAEILEKLRIDVSLLADIYESQEVAGAVCAVAAELTGLKAGTVVVGGAGDNAAAAVGTGVVKAGRAFTTIGSSGVVYAVSDEVSIDKGGRVHTLCASVPGKWTVMSCTQAAGTSLKWLKENCGGKEIMEAQYPYSLMGQMAGSIAPGAGGLLYLPYLMGERSPHPDPDCRGVFFGLSAAHGYPHMVRAVMEGVAYSQLECVEVFREMGVSVREMMVCGGGGRSPLWRQMLADMYGCPVTSLPAEEGPALGAAILAAVGAGLYSSLEEACGEIVRTGETLEPDDGNRGVYLDYYPLYKKLYSDLKDDFKTLSALHVKHGKPS